MTTAHEPRYWVRYTVPPGGVGRAIDEVMGLWGKRWIDGVLLFVGQIEERGRGLDTLDDVRRWLAEVNPLLGELRRRRIPWGLNTWQTIGFSRFAPGLRRAVPFQPMVGHDGTVVEEWACPLDERFVEHVTAMYGLLVEPRPEMIWIDDDFRYWGRNPAPLTCFCPLHRAAMAAATGRNYTRRSLVKAIGDRDLEQGRIRRAWLKVQYESLAEIASNVRRRVKEVSPATRVALMTGGMEHRSVDGWDWPDLIKRLWPKDRVRIRPGFGFYSGGDPRPYLLGTVYPRHQQALLPRDAELWPELENYPGTAFSRSTKTMVTQMLIASFLGMGHDVTLSVTGMTGNPIDDSLSIFADLHRWRPTVAAINAAVADHPQEAGLKLLVHPGVGRFLDWRSDVPWHWPLQRPWDYVLPPMGFPVGFRVEPGVVSVGSGGPLAEAMGAKELRRRLKDGMYVDGPFAAAMARVCGLAMKVNGPAGGAAFEEISDGEFGRAGDIISLRQTPRLWRIDPGRQGRVVSWCCDHAGKRITPGHVLFDFGSRGRLAVTAIDGQSLTDQWTYFRYPSRKRQLEATMTWLGEVPAYVRDLPDVYPLVRRGRGGWLLGLANLRDDPWRKVAFDLHASKKPRRVEALSAPGRWKPVRFKAQAGPGGKTRLTLPGAGMGEMPLAVWRVVI